MEVFHLFLLLKFVKPVGQIRQKNIRTDFVSTELEELWECPDGQKSNKNLDIKLKKNQRECKKLSTKVQQEMGEIVS